MEKEKVARTSHCTAYLQQRRVIEVGEIEQIFTQR
jgi:ABC-type phosphate transport system ATPase subunit